jgi:hypothetical protein
VRELLEAGQHNEYRPAVPSEQQLQLEYSIDYISMAGIRGSAECLCIHLELGIIVLTTH